MRFSEPSASPLDIVFWLFRTRVRINPGFWIMCLFLGWGYLDPRGLGMTAFGLWVLAVTVSILLHEYGHIFAGWAFRQQGEILLHTMGGLAIYGGDALRGWQQIIISLAGPAIQLALFAGLYFGFGWPTSVDSGRHASAFFLDRMLVVNLYWPILNLLPIWPLDGGQVIRQVCLYVTRYGVMVSLWISLLVSGFLAVNAVMSLLQKPPLLREVAIPFTEMVMPLPRGPFGAMMFGLFAVSALSELFSGTDAGSAPRNRKFDDPDWK